jgi:hypothetical protein
MPVVAEESLMKHSIAGAPCLTQFPVIEVLRGLTALFFYGSGLLVWPIFALIWRGKRRTTALRWVFFSEFGCILALCGLAFFSVIKLQHGYDWCILLILLNLFFTGSRWEQPFMITLGVRKAHPDAAHLDRKTLIPIMARKRPGLRKLLMLALSAQVAGTTSPRASDSANATPLFPHWQWR